MKTILIVDSDLGFVFWLGQILDAAGAIAVPARGIPEAAEIVAMLRLPVDVLIAPPDERGLREFVEELRFSSPELQVVALANPEDPAWTLPPRGAVWKLKPRCRDEASRSAWLGLIHDLDRNCLAPMSHG